MDGATKGNPGPATVGGVLCGHKGEWLMGFTKNLGICSSMKAKIRAVLREFKIVKEQGISKLWIQLDSKVLVEMLQESMHGAFTTSSSSSNVKI